MLAGIVCAVVGFTSSFAVVLAGLRAVGASPAQAASGLTALCLTMGLGSLWFSWRTRMPVTMAWSTPGAALLAASAAPAGGFGTAVLAFVITGTLILLCGLVRPLQRLVELIPAAVAHAMLAGVLLSLCVVPFARLPESPWALGPVIAAWLLLTVLRPRLAVPGALVAALVVMAVDGSFTGVDLAASAPTLTVVSPHLSWGAALALAVPLFLVTMTSQNIPGMAVLASFGYRPRFGPMLGYTGAATVVGAVAGGHAVNLAAISAALAAGPEAGEDRSRRWWAGVSCGFTYLAVGPLSALVAAVAVAAPAGLLTGIAGLALVNTLAGSARASLEVESTRFAAALTFVVAASGIAMAGIGAAFWALVAGLVAVTLQRVLHRGAGTGADSGPHPAAAPAADSAAAPVTGSG